MLLTDINVLIYAARTEMPKHEDFAQWLSELVNGSSSFGMSDQVLSGFMRIATHPGVFEDPLSTDEAIAFVETIRERPNCVQIAPGARHWPIFTGLCRRAGAIGKLIPDAYFAALAIEHGCEWITTDRDYARFPGLKWRTPF